MTFRLIHTDIVQRYSILGNGYIRNVHLVAVVYVVDTLSCHMQL